MYRQLFLKLLVCFSFNAFCIQAFSAEETFLLINGITNATVVELGPHINKQISPYSTFKITLSLMGYDAGILKTDKKPTWDYQEEYDDWIEEWKAPQTPQSWIKYSCVWYSKLLALKLGLDQVQSYLSSLEYGNQDLSGEFAKLGSSNPVWINSSLKISPKEQVEFIQKMLKNKLPISNSAIQMTKMILFKEDLPGGWKLFGKTGTGNLDLEHGWFVGWIEKKHYFFPFAYLIRDHKINFNQRIPRVKQLLEKSNIMSED